MPLFFNPMDKNNSVLVLVQNSTKPHSHRQRSPFAIGGLEPFEITFSTFFDVFQCHLFAPNEDIDKREFIRKCFQELFTTSQYSHKLKERGYILTPYEYSILDYVLQVNGLEVCFTIFMQIYFRTINKALSDLPNKKEENLLLCYHKLWPSFFYGALQIEAKIQEMYRHTSTRFFESEIKNNIFAGKTKIAIKEWKKFFFNENEHPDLHVPLTICKLLEEEFTGTSCFIEVATTLLTSYRILGIYPTNFTHGYHNSFLIEMLEFIDWHNKKFPERLPTSSQFLTSKNCTCDQLRRRKAIEMPEPKLVWGGSAFIKQSLIRAHNFTELEATAFLNSLSFHLCHKLLKITSNNNTSLKKILFENQPLSVTDLQEFNEHFKESVNELSIEKLENWVQLTRTNRLSMEEPPRKRMRRNSC